MAGQGNPGPPSAPPVSSPIVDAAAAALAKHLAAQQQAIEAAAIGQAKGTLGAFLAGELNPASLDWSYVEGGSVVADDGTYRLAVMPDQSVWLVEPDGQGGWEDAQPVESLVDAAELLGLT